jgi:glc operon protein GlcG
MTMAVAVGTTQAQLIDKTALTLDGAKQIMAVAEARAKRDRARVVIALVDEGGSLLLLERLDDAQVASVNVGIDKARTAAIYRRPSKVFEDQVKNGRVSALALHGAVALQGGCADYREWKGDRSDRCQWGNSSAG